MNGKEDHSYTTEKKGMMLEREKDSGGLRDKCKVHKSLRKSHDQNIS